MIPPPQNIYFIMKTKENKLNDLYVSVKVINEMIEKTSKDDPVYPHYIKAVKMLKQEIKRIKTTQK